MLKISLLAFATFIWGAGFVGTRWTLIDYSPLYSNTLRFVFAGTFAIPYLIWSRKRVSLKAVAACSVLLLIALQLQTIGIEKTTLAKSGFLTTFYAIFTPIFSVVLFKEKIRKAFWILVGFSLIGVAFLCQLKFDQFNQGDFFILLSSIFFSFHIHAIERLALKEDSFVFNLYQCLGIGLLASLISPFIEPWPSLSPLLQADQLLKVSSLSGFLILSLFSSIMAFSIQIYAQKGTPAHIVSLIFLLESVFSAIFGYFIFKETLGVLGVLGAVIVLTSVAVLPLFTRFKKSIN